jgi:hypothetical protein
MVFDFTWILEVFAQREVGGGIHLFRVVAQVRLAPQTRVKGRYRLSTSMSRSGTVRQVRPGAGVQREPSA